MALRRRQVLRTLFVAALLVGIVLTGRFAVALFHDSFILPQTDRGRCYLFVPYECTSLTLTTIEDAARVSLPSDTEIVDSSSSSGVLTPKMSYVGAILRFPDGEPKWRSGSDDPFVGGTRMQTGLEQSLRQHGVSTITGRHAYQVDRASSGEHDAEVTIVTGTDDRGTPWAAIAVRSLAR